MAAAYWEAWLSHPLTVGSRRVKFGGRPMTDTFGKPARHIRSEARDINRSDLLRKGGFDVVNRAAASHQDRDVGVDRGVIPIAGQFALNFTFGQHLAQLAQVVTAFQNIDGCFSLDETFCSGGLERRFEFRRDGLY